MSMISRRSLVTSVAGALAAMALSSCSSPAGAPAAADAAAGADGANETNMADGAAGDGMDLHVLTQHEDGSPAWVSALQAAQDEATTQLFVVAGMSEQATTASISMHERAEDGSWRQVLSTPGFVGKNGLCADADHREGCGQTPMGTYHFTEAFGIADDPGCDGFAYVKVDDDTYWSGDDREGMHYNEMVSLSDYPDLSIDNSEHIVDYEYQYQHCLNISFNEDGVPGRGSAIFLHCFGPNKPYTGGCVSVPEYTMVSVLRRVRPDCVVVIGTLDSLHAEL